MQFLVFFFFQAEDGIRDRTVTGVQTCALPISELLLGRRRPPQAVPSPLHLLERAAQGGLGGSQRLTASLQRDLELGQLGVHVVVGLQAQPPGLLAGLGQDPVGFGFRSLHHLFAGGHAELLLLCLLHDPLRVAAGLGQELLTILHHPPGLLDLLGQGLPHLGHQLQDLLPVQQGRRGERHGLRFPDPVLHLLQAGRKVHYREPPSFSASRSATTAGTSPETSPPYLATSLTRDEDRNDQFGAVVMNRVSTPDRLRFIWAIWISYSKSVTARRPLTMTLEPRSLA